LPCKCDAWLQTGSRAAVAKEPHQSPFPRGFADGEELLRLH